MNEDFILEDEMPVSFCNHTLKIVQTRVETLILISVRSKRNIEFIMIAKKHPGQLQRSCCEKYPG